MNSKVAIVALLFMGIIAYLIFNFGTDSLWLPGTLNNPIPQQSASSSQYLPPQLPIPETNPGLQDNLGEGPIDEQGNRTYRNDAFGFELKYPAEFTHERLIFMPSILHHGALERVLVEFTGFLKGSNKEVKLDVLASRQEGVVELCSTCDPRPEDIVTRTLGGQSGEFIPFAHYARVEHNGIHYSIRVYETGGAGSSDLDVFFKEVTGSFKFF